MPIIDYKISVCSDVTDLQVSSMEDYDEYARNMVVQQLARYIGNRCDIQREKLPSRHQFSPDLVRFSTEVYVFNYKQLMGLINTEISNALVKAGKDYASKR